MSFKRWLFTSIRILFSLVFGFFNFEDDPVFKLWVLRWWHVAKSCWWQSTIDSLLDFITIQSNNVDNKRSLHIYSSRRIFKNRYGRILWILTYAGQDHYGALAHAWQILSGQNLLSIRWSIPFLSKVCINFSICCTKSFSSFPHFAKKTTKICPFEGLAMSIYIFLLLFTCICLLDSGFIQCNLYYISTLISCFFGWSFIFGGYVIWWMQIKWHISLTRTLVSSWIIK